MEAILRNAYSSKTLLRAVPGRAEEKTEAIVVS
jgi:hypothetical protein